MDDYLSPIPAEELSRRIAALQRVLQTKDIDAALVVQKTDLYYFAGTSQQGWLYIPAEGVPLLMVFKDLARARAESTLERVVSLLSPKKIPETLGEMGYSLPGRLGMELDVLPANLYFQFSSIFTPATILDVATEIRLVRAVKSAYEIGIIREACVRADRVAARFAELIEPGKSEVQLAGEIEGYARSLGHQGLVRMRLFGSELFYGHLMCGASAAVPSYLASPTGGEGVSRLTGQGAGYKRIVRDEPILFDYVFALNGYIADHTRIFAIGSLPDPLLAAHEAMLEIQEMVKRRAVPGAVTGELYEEMLVLAGKKGYAEQFMGAGERKIRFTGHGVGLELDEFPFIASGQKLELEENMVLAMEPKAIFPDIGVVGIENTHLVTARGLEQLTTYDEQITFIP